MNKTSNRKVKVTFKSVNVLNPQTQEPEVYTRPPFYTTEHNLDNVKRLHGKIYKEAVFVDTDEKLDTNNSTNVKVVEKIVEKEVIKEVHIKAEFTDSDMVLALSKKGKTNVSIARTLDIPVTEVEAILNK